MQGYILQERAYMNIYIEISIGEYFDKVTILEIKKDKIHSKEQLVNIIRELDYLNNKLDEFPFSRNQVEDEIIDLREVNEKLWLIEDEIREKESQKTFDQSFIDLARAVYITNDKRSEIKRTINLKLGSDFVEEKSYEDYN